MQAPSVVQENACSTHPYVTTATAVLRNTTQQVAAGQLMTCGGNNRSDVKEKELLFFQIQTVECLLHQRRNGYFQLCRSHKDRIMYSTSSGELLAVYYCPLK